MIDLIIGLVLGGLFLGCAKGSKIDNPYNHYLNKNNGCLYCSSPNAPKCPYHDKKREK